MRRVGFYGYGYWDGIIKVGHVLGFCLQKRFGIRIFLVWLVRLVFVVLFKGLLRE
jgi:hypothetical protein